MWTKLLTSHKNQFFQPHIIKCRLAGSVYFYFWSWCTQPVGLISSIYSLSHPSFLFSLQCCYLASSLAVNDFLKFSSHMHCLYLLCLEKKLPALLLHYWQLCRSLFNWQLILIWANFFRLWVGGWGYFLGWLVGFGFCLFSLFFK